MERVQGSGQGDILRNHLTEVRRESYIKTWLPSGRGKDRFIVVMVRVTDGLGSSSNKTELIKVADTSYSLSFSLTRIEQRIQTARSTISLLDRTRMLNVLALEIQSLGNLQFSCEICSRNGECRPDKTCACREGFYLPDCSMSSQ